MNNKDTAIRFRPIRARVDDGAIEKVTRFYAGTIDEMFNETFQNARRAAATRIDVTLCEDTELGTTIDIHDDGEGIADPQMLLSFGASAWGGTEARSEDPAGMGFYALARTRCCIISRAKGTGTTPVQAWPVQAWSVWLGPEHFTGSEAAVPQSETPNWEGSGTTVHVRWPATREAIAEAIERCGRYQNIAIRIDGAPIAQGSFLEGAIHTETWRGATIAVMRSKWGRGRTDAQGVCVHGVAVEAKTAHVEEIAGERQWYARVMATQCEGLELVLPGRKELVKNEWADAMRAQAKNTIYRAIAGCGERVALRRSDREAARNAGVALPDPAPRLRPWRPETPAEYASDALWDCRDQVTEAGPGTLVMVDPTVTKNDHFAQVLRRALETAGEEGNIFTEEPELTGVPWYDALRKITAVAIEALEDGRWQPVEQWDTDGCANDATRRRVQALRARCTLNDTTQKCFEVDVAFARANGRWDALRGTLIAAQATTEAWEVEQRIVDTLFIPDDGWDSASWEMHQRQFETDAKYEARCLLEGVNAAAAIALESAADEHLAHFAPKGARAVIIIENGTVKASIEERTDTVRG